MCLKQLTLKSTFVKTWTLTNTCSNQLNSSGNKHTTILTWHVSNFAFSTKPILMGSGKWSKFVSLSCATFETYV